MTDTQATPIADLVQQLMSAGLSGGQVVEAVRAVEIAAAKTTSSRGSSISQREKWRLQKEAQRAKMSGGHGRTTDSALLHCKNLNVDKKKKEPNEDVRADIADKPKRTKAEKGERLPHDWVPKESHYAKGRQYGFDVGKVNDFADRMRNWAGSNGHRAVARKSDWDKAFHNWLSDKGEKNGVFINGKTQGADIQNAGFAGIAARIRHGAGADARRPAPEDLEPIN